MAIMVTSPLFMDRIRLSWLPSKTVVFDCPFVKPEMFGSKKRLFINIVDELLEHQTLEDLGERGKYRDRSIPCVLFWIVDFRAGWDVCSFPDAWKLRIRDTHIDDMCKRTRKESPTCFIYLTGIWSTPVEHSNLNRVISLRTSSVDTVRSWKG